MQKFDNKLNQLSNDLGKQLSVDNLYRNSAYLSFSLLVVITFFISLASAAFDFAKILEAQFWLDFIITLGGSMFLKYVFGKYGNFEGHKFPQVKQAQKSLNDLNYQIDSQNLATDLKIYVNEFNKDTKLLALKAKTYKKLTKKPRSKKWLKIKRCILLSEEFVDASKERQKEILVELDELNFTMEQIKIKHNKISEASLQTGLPQGSQEENEKMTFNEMKELFGKQFYLTTVTTLFTILAAASSLTVDKVSTKILVIFLLRIVSYVMNSFVGFVSSKSAVETIKLNVLRTVYLFLKRFLEIKRGDTNGNNQNA